MRAIWTFDRPHACPFKRPYRIVYERCPDRRERGVDVREIVRLVDEHRDLNKIV
jgi:hypothetical protein